ncbi:MAG: carboxypeptidase regulatory-like domain-containing protein [Terriglobales bacterium]
MAPVLWAQSQTTAAIAGRVVDPSHAALPGAVVAARDLATGARRATRTDATGWFSLAQLAAGSYALRISAPGFQTRGIGPVSVGLGQIVRLDVALRLASRRQSVTVTANGPVLDTENANTSTTLSARRLRTLPNPGGDLTYPAQFAPGALINTAGSSNDFVGGTNGYGNVEFNGLPATSNGYIVDGMETNDPFTGLNSGLSTNLVLGLNSIAAVTVNTLSYRADQGGYGAAQVDYITKSGSQHFHGNLYETWNGAALNAADFFANAQGGAKANATVNHFGGSLGGPLRSNRLFFFVDAEWIRLRLPIVTTITVPTSALEPYVLSRLVTGGSDPLTGASYPAEPQLVPFYRRLFDLYPSVAGTPLPVAGCPIGSGAGGALPDGDGCAQRFSRALSSADHEQVQTVRLDQPISSANVLWYRFQADTGLQAAYTDVVNPIFDAVSPQPMYSLAIGYTHVFSPSLVNDFNPAASWYSSLFAPADLSRTLAAFPIVLQGIGGDAPFSPLGGLDNTWLQGRRVSRFFLNDNLDWTTGAHQIQVGVNARVFRLNDFDFGEGITPTVTYTDLAQFANGIASTATASFPAAASQPFNFLNTDLYAEDTWNATSALTLTLGARFSLDPDPVNPHNLISRLPAAFNTVSHAPSQPLNEALQTGQSDLFYSSPLAIVQPRVGAAWQIAPRLVLRGGFGVFNDLMPGSIADLLGANPPYVNTFEGGLLGTAGGLTIAPGGADSAVAATTAANASFLAGFSQGELSCAAPGANPNACLPAVALTVAPGGELHPPISLQWSFGLERQLGQSTSLLAQYVGTRGLDQLYTTQVNGYQTVCPGCFAPYPYATSTDPRFAAVTQLNTGATSFYNGLQMTLTKRMNRSLAGSLNYTWSHCLDEVSNGGLLPFSAGAILSPLPGELARNYGPCDYDIRHNITGDVVYKLPGPRSGSGWLRGALDGWQLSATLFWHTGVPFSVLSAPYAADGEGIINGGGPQYASLVPGQPLYDRNPIPGVTQPGTLQWLNPAAFRSVVDPATGACVGGDSSATCQFGDLGRNALRGPGFFWDDLYLTKSISLGEGRHLRLQGKFFNIFNHPNFALPTDLYAGMPGNPAAYVGFGALTATTSPPTGLLGVGLGGDSAPRMIALEAMVQF